MASIRVKQGSPKAIESWILQHFGGTDAKESVSNHAEHFVQKAGINKAPVSMVKLANAIGVDPWPVYEYGVEGALKVIDGRMRIVLRRSAGANKGQAAVVGRARFTYAHELGHTFFYDLKPSPPVRLAPSDNYRVEEQLCNKAASRFLVPEFLLRQTLSNVDTLSPNVIRQLADKFQTSIQVISYRIAESFSAELAPNQLFMLSSHGPGVRGTGENKPRCLVCILGPALLAEKITFLRTYEGINKVKRSINNAYCHWSLEEYFLKSFHQKPGSTVESKELLLSPARSVFELTARHSTVGHGGLVWSEGTLILLDKKCPSQTD